MSTKEKLRDDVNSFLERHDMRASNFGRMVRNNSALVIRIRSLKVSDVEAVDAIYAWMAAYDKSHPVKKKRRGVLERATVAA